MTKLHIGCGKRVLQGWVHIDLENFPHIDHQIDIRNIGDIFANNTIDEIYACHVFEHISRDEIDNVFQTMFNILKPGGILRLAVPDIGAAIRLYTEQDVPLYPSLYDQFWGGHKIGFDMRTLSFSLAKVGFCSIERYDWRDFLPKDFDDLSIPHMDFDHGVNLSMNAIAKKPTTDMKNVVAFCAGGLCNALASLITANTLAKKLNRALYVYWLDGYIANDMKLTDIFNIYSQNGGPLVHIVDAAEHVKMCTKGPMLRLSHMDTPEFKDHKYNCPLQSIHQYSSIQDINTDLDIFIYDPILPAFITPADLSNFFETFSIKPLHMKQASDILAKSNVALGLHLRGTDILSISGHSLRNIYEFVMDKFRFTQGGRIFICSDDENIEAMFRNDTNIVMHKKEYVTRRDPTQHWYVEDSFNHLACATNLEHNGKKYKNFASVNVVRTTNQVIGGWIDLLTLAQVPSIEGFHTSRGSTYFSTAKILHAYFAEKKVAQL